MQQAPAALELVLGARRLGLSTLMFSGYALDELRAQTLGPAVLAHLDVLIDGRYVAGERLSDGLRGSANQQIRILSSRHTAAEVAATPHAEIQIGPDGSMSFTGVAPLTIRSLR
jgi:anaerobic ribonucleoside-triphosphate reductase activating protein